MSPPANPSFGDGAGPGRVLVVDDEEALVRVIARVLTAAGYRVSTAADGKEATGMLARATFDVILSDIDMPEMDGIQFLQDIRRRDADVPVVLMTGNPDLTTAVLAVEHGALQYLVKPADLDGLLNVVARAVGLNRMAKLKQAALVLVSHGGLGVADRLALEASFERALDTMWIAYQPIVRVTDRSLFGYEVLLRSDEAPLPSPEAILDAGERLGRLEHLGQSIRAGVTAAVSQAPAGSTFFVNLHPCDLMDDTLFFADAPLSTVASRVVLELTERASLDQVKDVRGKLRELRRIGFRIAIDDLGAGYAGLTSFATLEPEFVKLDMSLVRDIDRSRTKETLVRSMTSLCKELGMQVVAEGVETRQECELLAELHCDFLQGYLFAKPGKAFPAFVW
jgi:EAL domain-containing protein (putative c-di-GMP-specific phosphodiesterase class I)/CheY-like chemotaxis protein